MENCEDDGWREQIPTESTSWSPYRKTGFPGTVKVGVGLSATHIDLRIGETRVVSELEVKVVGTDGVPVKGVRISVRGRARGVGQRFRDVSGRSAYRSGLRTRRVFGESRPIMGCGLAPRNRLCQGGAGADKGDFRAAAGFRMVSAAMISVRGIVVRVEGQQLKSVAGSAGDSANLLGDSE